MNALLVSLLVATLALVAVSAAPAKEQKVSNVTDATDATEATDAAHMAEAMVNLLTAFQKIMPCGDESLDIPVMAPFRIPKVEVDVDEDLLILKGHIKNLVVSGINDFIIIELAGNSSTNRTNFDVVYNGIHLFGSCDLHVDADMAGFRYVQDLKGLIDLQVLNVRVTGGMTVGMNEVGGIVFSDLEYFVQVGDIISNGIDINWSVAVNNFVNQYLRDSSMLFLQTNRVFLSEVISGYATPLVNNAFYNISSSQYLQAMVDATQMYNAIECSP